ncbi:O-succinylbenzoic acid--CoA ligase [Natronorubrum daqingense]|uniref:2-succinylbenzoate-CoA ligase n=2 Tax=Natronorubrum daqingense TaxID=588898 RepID=A0A1N6XDV3_9EURY|nr:2-succinylbenzoate-CoA ligase [Natronorubrum daqingense]SIR00526.1 O-succinylbenzoic acid--CoA ligase [Natronorubrum daqingense]
MIGDPLADAPRDLLAMRTETTPERTALLDDETRREWSYGELDALVDRVAETLDRTLAAVDDTRARPRLGTLVDTRPAFVTLVFAAMRAGIIVVPLNVRETTDELAWKAQRTALTAIVCERETESAALEVAETVDTGGSSTPVLSVDEPSANRTGRIRATLEETARSPNTRSPQTVPSESSSGTTVSSSGSSALERDETFLIMFTSGTSGDPKGVRLTLGNLIASATASAFRLGTDPSDRWLCCLPMYHMGGLAPVVRSTLYGTTVVIQRTFDRNETARVLEEYEITGVSLVPTMCKRLLDGGWEPDEALRFVLLGGAPASSELLDRCLAADVPVYPTYGMTETASQIATATPQDLANHTGTAGTPLLVTDVTVVDEDGDPLDPGETGEFVVSGPTVTPGYLEDAHTNAAFDEYGLHTGDIGYRDDGGRLWVLNRRSDRIVTGGENVDPGEVIAAIRSHPDVDTAVVLGLEDSEWGERVAALVVPDESGRSDATEAESADSSRVASSEADSIDLESVLERCGDSLAGFKQPKTIALADSLPRTASGTVDRDGARALLLERGIDVSELS